MSEPAEKPKKKKRRGAPRKLRFTREGRVFVLATLGVGAAAVNTGNNLLYLVLGLMLSLIVLSGILSEVVLRNVRVRRTLPRRAFAGTPCLIELEVENQKPRAPSYSIELEDVAESRAGETDGRCYFLKVAPGERQRASYRLVPTRRGRITLTGVIVRTRYPFGLFEKWRVLSLADELIAFPALAAEAPEPPGDGSVGREVPARRPGIGTEIIGLREYREGDEARSIHWRRTASLGRMVVREHQRDAARRVTMVIDESRPQGAGAVWDEHFERMLSRVATATSQALDAGAAVEAVARSGSSPLVLPGQPPDPVWRFLALLETRDATEEQAELPVDEPGQRHFEVGAA